MQSPKKNIVQVIDRVAYSELRLKLEYRQNRISAMRNDWRKCRKRPVIVEFREVHADETGIETLEGFRPCDPEKHLVIRGINGELYPIDKDVFTRTYDVLD